MPYHERTNINLALAVRYGIILDMELGAVKAWTFMATSGVSSPVITRVLLDKEKRRNGDKQAVDIAERHRKSSTNREAVEAAFNITPRKMSV